MTRRPIYRRIILHSPLSSHYTIQRKTRFSNPRALYSRHRVIRAITKAREQLIPMESEKKAESNDDDRIHWTRAITQILLDERSLKSESPRIHIRASRESCNLRIRPDLCVFFIFVPLSCLDDFPAHVTSGGGGVPNKFSAVFTRRVSTRIFRIIYNARGCGLVNLKPLGQGNSSGLYVIHNARVF